MMFFLRRLAACPFLNQQLAVTQSEAYFNKNCVSAICPDHIGLRSAVSNLNRLLQPTQQDHSALGRLIDYLVPRFLG